jgi:AcrR family transcriptional regulator
VSKVRRHVDRPAEPPAREDGYAARRAATRAQVMDAATTLMAERGFDGTSVDDIAKAARVAKGTIFYNFGNKDQLFLEVMRSCARRMVDRLHAATDGRHGPEALDFLVRSQLEATREHPDLVRFFMAELYRSRELWRGELREIREDVVRAARELIVQSQLRGSADPDVDPDVAAGLLIAVVLVAALDWQSFYPERALEDVHGDLVRLLAGRFGPLPTS